jgi:hypothetical protein
MFSSNGARYALNTYNHNHHNTINNNHNNNKRWLHLAAPGGPVHRQMTHSQSGFLPKIVRC